MKANGLQLAGPATSRYGPSHRILFKPVATVSATSQPNRL